jgi:SAM-dependent methyltransferase
MTDRLSSSRDTTSREWFEDWFNHSLYLKVYQHRDTAEAALCVDTILGITGCGDAHHQSAVLDIACGAGRHALEFARRGLQVSANDLSMFLLGTAEDEARKAELAIRFSGFDMRYIRLDCQFDLIVQLFSSFGYFETDEEDKAVIRNVSKMLLDSGWYVLDLINPVYLKKGFIPNTTRSVESLSITEERSLSDRKVSKKITISDQLGETLSFTESVRLYSKAEISALLESEGMEIIRTAGDYQGSDFEESSSPRMLLFVRKQLSS